MIERVVCRTFLWIIMPAQISRGKNRVSNATHHTSLRPIFFILSMYSSRADVDKAGCSFHARDAAEARPRTMAGRVVHYSDLMLYCKCPS